MEAIIKALNLALVDVVEIATMAMEFAGIVVLVVSAVKAFYHWIRKSENNIRLDLSCVRSSSANGQNWAY